MARSVSKTRQNAYASYKTSQRWKINRERKLQKLIKLHPNNLQLVEALKNISYRRNTPKAPKWSHATKAMAQLRKEFSVKLPIVREKYVPAVTVMAFAFRESMQYY